MLFQKKCCQQDCCVAKRVGADIERRSSTPREIFGLAVTELRIQRGESQADAAHAIGCQEFYLRNIEQGKENFSFDIMHAIVDHYDMLPMTRFWSFVEELTDKGRKYLHNQGPNSDVARR